VILKEQSNNRQQFNLSN